jgi:hypothetical protein
MNSHRHPDWSKLDAYLDDALADQERDRMSREIGASGQLQAEVELQTQVDESLRRLFAPAAPPSNLLSQLRESAPAELVVNRMWRRRATLAVIVTAATIVWGVVAWQFFARGTETTIYNPNQPLATIYAMRVADGFRPTWVCEDKHEFAATFFARQGQGLLLADMPEGAKMEGLTYCGGISRYTTTMLSRVDKLPVMVFVDRASADTHPTAPSAATGLHLFRKELGPLVLYEISPLDHPSVMDYLYLADVPPAK